MVFVFQNYTGYTLAGNIVYFMEREWSLDSEPDSADLSVQRPAFLPVPPLRWALGPSGSSSAP